jgi:hypothetical protein
MNDYFGYINPNASPISNIITIIPAFPSPELAPLPKNFPSF